MTTAFKKELYNEDLVYSSVLFGMGFWIDDQGLFLSAPEFRDGSLDIDMRYPYTIGRTSQNLQSITCLTYFTLFKCVHLRETHKTLNTTQEFLEMSKKPNGINIQLTPCQFDYLYEVIMMAYELDVPDQKGWDMQTYDNMVDNVTNGTSTYLTNDVKGILHRPVD